VIPRANGTSRPANQKIFRIERFAASVPQDTSLLFIHFPEVATRAGAMRTAGLKNITAKHPALASQSLSIVITFISCIRETFLHHLSHKRAVLLVEFDKLDRDNQQPQNEFTPS
jgi:hypothetical protein